jgi:hypothetical protein
MSATNGSTRPVRSRARIVLGALAAVFALSAVLASAASAHYTVTQTQLSLGDSLAFGYSKQLYLEHLGVESPTSFEHGYANVYFNQHHPKENGLGLTNLGCPGETTDSMIGNGPLGAALDPTEGESACAYQKAGAGSGKGGPLHTEYEGGKSQLEKALEVIYVDSLTGKPVTTITLNIGANDELHVIGKCEEEAKPAEAAAYQETLEKGGTEAEAKAAAEAAGKAYVKSCIETHANAMFGHILHNIGSMLFAIRHGSLFGGADYAGKIVVQGGYDPYGNVFGTGELLVGSNALASILNFHENKLVTDTGTEAAEEGHEPFGACYSNPQTNRFNPGTHNEPKILQTWTNMANPLIIAGQPAGPDIHPTPLGYSHLAKYMVTDCG